MMYLRCTPPRDEEDEQEDMFRKKVQSLWHEECLVDVSLACENEILTAHKLVLSAYSDYFKTMFLSMKNGNQYPIIFLKDVSCDVLKAILKFMYCGEVNVAQSNLNDFMKTARSLQIKGLSIITDDEENESMEEYSTKKRQGSMSDRQHTTSSPPMKKMRQKMAYESNEEDEMDTSYHSYKSKEHRQTHLSNAMVQEDHQLSGSSSMSQENVNHGRLSGSSARSQENINHRRLSGSSARSQENVNHSRLSGSSARSQEHIPQHRPFPSSVPPAQENALHHRSSSNTSSIITQENGRQRRSSTAPAPAQHKSKNSVENKPGASQGRQVPQSSMKSTQSNKSYNESEDDLPNSGLEPETDESDKSDHEVEDNPAMIPDKETPLLHPSKGAVYKEKTMMKALDAISKGKTVNAAAKAYKISAKILGSRLQMMQANNTDTSPGMSQEHEAKLMNFIDYMSQITPLTCNQVRLFAWGIDSVLGNNKFGGDGPTKNWWNHFKRKNPKINKVLRKVDFLKSNKLKSEAFSFKSLIDYLVPIQEIIEAFDLNNYPQNVWSCGEYSVNLKSPPEECFFPSRERFFNDDAFDSSGEYASVMFAGSASGTMSPPFAVFKDHVPNKEFTNQGPQDATYNQNSSGFMDADLMLKWFEHTFLPMCPQDRSEENPVILLLNSSFCLTSPEMLDLALSEHVMLLSLMPHLHHTCQPMDLPIVNDFRSSFVNNLKAEFGDKLSTKVFRSHFPRLMKESLEKDVSSEEVVMGFRVCGIFPLMVEVDQNLYMNLRAELNFDAFVKTSLKSESTEVEMEKLVRSQNRKIKLLQKQDKEVSTSDEDEEAMDVEDSSAACYVCENPFPKGGGSSKDRDAKRIRCTKRHCKNYSCDECLPINYDKGLGFICIDCNR